MKNNSITDRDMNENTVAYLGKYRKRSAKVFALSTLACQQRRDTEQVVGMNSNYICTCLIQQLMPKAEADKSSYSPPAASRTPTQRGERKIRPAQQGSQHPLHKLIMFSQSIKHTASFEWGRRVPDRASIRAH